MSEIHSSINKWLSTQLYIPGDMLSLRFESGPLCWEFGILLWHHQNIINLQTNTKIILFSAKNTISNQSSVTVIHQKFRAGRYEKNVIGHFYLSYQIRQCYVVLKLGSTQIRKYSLQVLGAGHSSNPKAIQSQMAIYLKQPCKRRLH